ncbi:acyl-CoA synthetase [Rhodococcus sp. 06-156-3C]|uniref:acyl-CoA synthetase n=1 Tax=Nocardiaceae TaxID=85025 RepID=UPI0009B89212|nr:MULTISPECIES: acyl-CoA synthetase [Rhodococcus]OZC49986.1 acyl-CoA synthetase [Rhodococcus sp. 06-621-2]OZD12303.1 acyl-CoA synthetase [Rhodococcus sp. 06-156-3C]OZD19032.1 acyl-CoA synthetase [Rhodococcus sp. 06-156-4C]OZD20929.1 acyl-CoA synthetase [Rhodococcus sp. 06-156-4a]OZD29104.1 acyl-CoA synthetase [Rhodococcus sp. 06-156-3b]
MRSLRRAANLAEVLRQTARRLPDGIALVHGDVRWTWHDLDRRVDSLAAELERRGVGKGDVVMLDSPNHPEFVQAMYATWRIGAVLAPVNSRLHDDDVAVIAGVCRPSAIVAHSSTASHVDAVRACGELSAGVLWIEGSDADAVAAVDESTPAAPVATYEGEPAWYFFTSGTSGTPKAAILTHDQLGFVVNNHLADLMPTTDRHCVSLVVAPLSHGAGVHMLPQVARGAATVLPPSGSLVPAEVWGLVESERVTNMFTVPTILKVLVDHPSVHQHDHSSLRHVIYAGAPMYAPDQKKARETLGEVLVQYYGLAEVTGNITVLPSAEHGRPVPEGLSAGTCGYPRTGMLVSVQDETGSELGPGEIGELCVAGPAVFAGYLDNDNANAEAFRDGWFRTGDLGVVDEDGFVYVTGRSSDMYISGGSNIHPRDIEEKILTHDAVDEVAVLGVPDPKWGEVGVAICVLREGADLTADQLSDWLGERMARYKLPRHILFRDSLPKSGYGKIVKRTIRDELAAQGWGPYSQTLVSAS